MADFFIRRPIVAMVIAILTVIVGTITLSRLPISEYPPVSPTMIQVTTTYRGAAAERHPLRYMITWAFSHVLREYVIKVNVLQDGRITEVDASTGREKFVFDKLGRNEELECAITPGMPSFIFTRPHLQQFAENRKVLRGVVDDQNGFPA